MTSSHGPEEKRFRKQIERESFWKKLSKEAAHTAKERARYRMVTGQNRGCPFEVILGVGAVLLSLSLVFAIIEAIKRTFQAMAQFAGIVLAGAAGIYVSAFVLVFVFGSLADWLRQIYWRRRLRRQTTEAIVRSPFPRHEYLQDERYLDAVIWKLIDSHLGRETVRIRSGIGFAGRKNRQIEECVALREALLRDRAFFDSWRTRNLLPVLRDPDNQPTLIGIYNEILKRVRDEAWGRRPATALLEVVGFTIVRDPDTAPRWLFTANALRFLTWGIVGGVDRRESTDLMSDAEEYGRRAHQKVREYLAHGDRFRRFMERYFFEIMGELGPYEFVLPKVHRYYDREREQQQHYTLLPSSRRAAVRILPAKTKTTEEAEELERHRQRAAELTRQAQARERERAKRVKKLRRQYLPSSRPGVIYTLFCEGRSGLEAEIRDLVLTQHDGNPQPADEGLDRLRATKTDFLRFWKAHETAVLEAHDERVMARSVITPEEEQAEWVNATVTNALRRHRVEQQEMRDNGYAAVDVEFGLLLAEARERVRRNLPAGECDDLENYLERALRDLLEQDARARERYFGDDVRRALHECEDFRQGRLPHRELVAELGYEPGADRDTLTAVFVENAGRWRKRQSARSRQAPPRFRRKDSQKEPPAGKPAAALVPESQPEPAKSSQSAGPTRDADTLLTEGEAAEVLRLTRRALQDWRVRGHGPPFVKISGRAVRYRYGDVQKWISGQIRRSTSDPGDSEPDPEDKTSGPEDARTS